MKHMKCSQENYIIPSNKIITSDSRNTFMISYFSHAKKPPLTRSRTDPRTSKLGQISEISLEDHSEFPGHEQMSNADQNLKGELLHEIRANDSPFNDESSIFGESVLVFE